MRRRRRKASAPRPSETRSRLAGSGVETIDGTGGGNGLDGEPGPIKTGGKIGGNEPPGGVFADGGEELSGGSRASGPDTSSTKNPRGEGSGKTTGADRMESEGSSGEVGDFGDSEIRLPQRPRARLRPSVKRVSPAWMVTLRRVQKI